MDRQRKYGQKGFTLLELLIALTIVAVIVTIISGALKISVRAWEKGERDTETNQRFRLVLERMENQISSLMIPYPDDSPKKFYFKGDSKSLSFPSLISLIPGENLGRFFVRYKLKENENGTYSLVFHEKNMILVSDKKIRKEPEEDEFYELIPKIKSGEFSYLEKQGALDPHESDDDEKDSPVWADKWDSKKMGKLPLAIKIELVPDSGSSPFILFIPLKRFHDL